MGMLHCSAAAHGLREEGPHAGRAEIDAVRKARVRAVRCKDSIVLVLIVDS